MLNSPTNLQELPQPKIDSANSATNTSSIKRNDLFWLSAITLLSAFLCFNQISHPSLLIDECFTYWRICGTQGELLDTLRNDAFVPLHYELLNWIRQGFPLGFGSHLVPGGILMTPVMMRIVPAISGFLMTPIMYFLARQIFNRRTALIAAAFIACSAYQLFFSHYAKMYAPAWMFATLMVACSTWWIRIDKRIAWLCWVASGTAAGGFHAITLLLVPLAPLYFISMGRFRAWRIPLLIWGLTLICIGPACYYAFYNQWTQNSGGIVPGVVGKTNDDADWTASGLGWLESVDNSFQPEFQALNNYLSGLDWKQLDDLENPSDFLEKYSTAMIALAVVTYGIFFFGALPWPHLRKQTDKPVQPWWRGLLWLLLWLVMPVYGFFYCRSVPDFSPPWVWFQSIADYLRPIWWQASLGAVVLVSFFTLLPRAAKFVGIPLLLGGATILAFSAADRWNWMNYTDKPSIQIAVLALMAGTIYHYSAPTILSRALQLTKLLAVIGVVFLCCTIMYFAWTKMHEISMRKHPDLQWQSVWHVRYVAVVMPAVWLAAAALVARLPTRPVRIAVVAMICSYNLANGLAREYASSEVPLDRVTADIYQSQPDSPTRTYFDMREIFSSTFYKPLALYNACVAAKIQPSPAEFRVGSSWPFEYGDAAEIFKNSCIYNNTIDNDQISADTVKHPEINRIVIWETSRTGAWLDIDDHASNPASVGLTDKWTLASKEEIPCRWNWDWTTRWWFRRREFRKTN
jgi:4-amino-4-deoxy-L-arabinose transferase-like glycosyltransferase